MGRVPAADAAPADGAPADAAPADAAPADAAAQPRHERLERVLRPGGQPLAPQLIDQGRPARPAARAARAARSRVPLDLTRRPGIVTDLKRTEHRDLHVSTVAGQAQRWGKGGVAPSFGMI
jgi:hypothetical protein